MANEENFAKGLVVSTIKPLIIGWGMVLFYVVFNSYGAISFKSQVQKLGGWNFSTPYSVLSYFFTLFSSWQTWMGLVSITIATGAWIIALANLELSKAYPVAIGFNLLIIVVLSIFHFNEPVTFSKMVGTFFVFTGVLFLFQ